MSLQSEFNNCPNELYAWCLAIVFMIAGFTISFGVYLFFTKEKDTYYHGQIDAIRGIIKYRLAPNENGEHVWIKIDKDEPAT